MRRALACLFLFSGLLLAAGPTPVRAYDSYAWGHIEDAPEENFVQRMLRSHGKEIMFGLAGLGVVGFLVLMGPGDVLDAWKRSGWRYRRGMRGFGGLGGFGGDDW